MFCFLSVGWILLLLENTFGLPDVYFLPGLAGSFIFATVKDKSYLPASCELANIPINERFVVYTNVTLTAHYPKCVANLLTLQYNESNTPAFTGVEGIEISTGDFGGPSGIMPVYLPYFEHLKEWGYKLGINVFGIPYDFRYSSAESLTAIGFIGNLKTLIERSYKLRHEKAILMGHSNGGPTIYTFISLMSKQWKEKYLGGMITLSGNLLGQLNAFSAFFHTNHVESQKMSTSWEATYTSTPWGNYQGLSELKDFIITYNGSEGKETHYSSSLSDTQSLFSSVNRSDWSTKLTALYPQMDRSTPPEGIDVYCLYGSEVDTSFSYVFDGSISENDPIATLKMNGDGNQDNIDNEFCLTWKDQVMNKQKKIFQSRAYPGVHHMQMCTNEEVLNDIYQILMKY
jgi:predicted alpha/beta hydrolase family esterase